VLSFAYLTPLVLVCVQEVDSLIEGNLQRLYRIVHTAPFSVAVQVGPSHTSLMGCCLATAHCCRPSGLVRQSTERT
jgi:hypothetical protein